MKINNKELKEITKQIDKIVKEAVKDQERVNAIIDKFKKDDEARMKAVDVLKAKRWNLLKTLNLGLKEFEVITELKIIGGELMANVEDLHATWVKNFKEQQAEQDKRANETLNPPKTKKTNKK
jgi:hypothetical protein